MNSSLIYCDLCGAANRPQAVFCVACGQRLTAPSGSLTGLLTPGSILKQRYQLLRQVGKGGFGAVYEAEDITLGNRHVAIKEMSQSGLSTQELKEATEAFQREGHLLANLQHACLPAIYDYFDEAGRWYLIMEYITGETLEVHLNKAPGGRLPVKEVLQIALQLCDVLEYLHTKRPPIIFRDLKPANVMVTPHGQVYLIDFGIARLFKPGQAKDTIAFGSPGYAAPEQYGKMQTTAQSDIYSLGATLHQMLSGTDPADRPFLFAPLGLPTPPRLVPLILQMVEQDQNKRPANMSSIKQQLKQIAEGQDNTTTPSITTKTSSPALPGTSLARVGYRSLPPAPASSSAPFPVTSSQPAGGALPQHVFVCPVCLQQHFIVLAAGYTSLYCPNNVRKTFSLLYAKTRVKRSHIAQGKPGIRIYQIRVVLPDKSEQMIDFPSKEGHFELRSGDEVIIAFFKERPKVVMNVAIRQYMLAAY